MDNQLPTDLFKVEQAAQYLGCSKNTIRNLIATGKVPAIRIGERIIRIRRSDIEALFTPYVGGEFGVWNK